jgi:hypothetical protein
MKWRLNVLYAKAFCVMVVLAGLVAAAAAGWKWN